MPNATCSTTESATSFTLDAAQFTIETADGRHVSWFDDDGFALLSRWWLQASWERKYSYQFSWLGRPVIQLPGDLLMMQDLIHRIRPTVIIETGVAHGGSVVFHASIMHLVHQGSAVIGDCPRVVAIDIEIKPANRRAIESHPLSSGVTLLEGNSIDPAIFDSVRDMIRPDDTVLVVLDSCHTGEHVLGELVAYAPLVTPGSAVVVMDGVMKDLATLPHGLAAWHCDHPGTAIERFLASDGGSEFAIDDRYDSIALTHSPRGVLVRST